jgi:hypothetical protein
MDDQGTDRESSGSAELGCLLLGLYLGTPIILGVLGMSVAHLFNLPRWLVALFTLLALFLILFGIKRLILSELRQK